MQECVHVLCVYKSNNDIVILSDQFFSHARHHRAFSNEATATSAERG